VSRPPTRLLLVRHGETEYNVERRFQGQRDSPLTERGRWQAARLGERLRAVPLDAVYSSDLPRTLATAEATVAGRDLTIQAVPAFREGHFGEYEGLTFAEIAARYGEAATRWAADPVALAPPGGETLAVLHERVAAFVGSVVAAHPGATVLLVGHGGSVRAAVMEALGLDRRHFRRLRMDNTSLSIIESDGAVETLHLFNDTSHLLDA
jgi:broad specificity phosphatase PhoE